MNDTQISILAMEDGLPESNGGGSSVLGYDLFKGKTGNVEGSPVLRLQSRNSEEGKERLERLRKRLLGIWADLMLKSQTKKQEKKNRDG